MCLKLKLIIKPQFNKLNFFLCGLNLELIAKTEQTD